MAQFNLKHNEHRECYWIKTMALHSRMALVCLLVVVFSALCHTTVANALVYHFLDGSPLCFAEVIENIGGTQITGTYNWIANSAYPASSVLLSMSVTDASQRKYYGKKMMEGEHSFAITLGTDVVPGEQLICFEPSSKFIATPANPLKLRVELDQAQKEEPMNKEKMAQESIKKRRQVDGLDVFSFREAGGQPKDILQPREYLNKIEKALDTMEFALDRLVADLNMTVQKESRMRQTSESTFTRVWVCAMLLIAVISGVLWMEFRFLKSTLRKKKLV